MTPLTIGILLALGSSVSHACWNVLAKQLAGPGLATVWVYSLVSLVLLAVPFGVVVAHDPGALSLTLVGAAALSGVLHAGYGALVQISYKHFDLGEVYPLSRGLAPVLVGVLGVLTLHQALSGWQWTGVALIGLAVVVTGAGGARPGRSASDGRRSGALWAAGIATAITSYTWWDGVAVLRLDATPVVYFCVSGLLQMLVLSLVARRRIGDGIALARREPARVLAVGALVPASYLLALVAVQHAPVAVVAAVRGVSVVWAVLAAVAVLRERIDLRRGLAIVAAFGAIAVMALG